MAYIGVASIIRGLGVSDPANRLIIVALPIPVRIYPKVSQKDLGPRVSGLRVKPQTGS